MTGSSERPAVTNPFIVPVNAEISETVRALNYRKDMVTAMTRHARDQGLDADEALVSRHYDWFHRWHIGVLATGYLMGRTGVKRIDRLKAFKGE